MRKHGEAHNAPCHVRDYSVGANMRKAFLTIVPAILAATCAGAQPAQSPADVRAPAEEYPSVAAALEAIRTKSGAKVTIQSGWTVVQDEASTTVWSFTPPSHPAYPAALRRSIVEHDGAFVVKSDAMCEAEKSACDQLMAEVHELDQRMIEASKKKQPGP
jgi:hypothetical protein